MSYQILFEIVVAHLVTEWIVSSFIFSKIYYEMSGAMMAKISKAYGHKCRVIFNWIYVTFKDKSNIYQWRVRCGVDIVIRFNAILLTAVFQIILNFLINADVRHYADNRGNVYNAIVIGLEIVYFGVAVFAYNYVINGCNIFYGFIGYLEWQENNMKYVVFTNCIVISMIYMFGFLGFLSFNY